MLGRVAAQTLLGSDESLGRMRGRWHRVRGIDARATYHPAALLRNSSFKRPTWEDMQVVRDRLREGAVERRLDCRPMTTETMTASPRPPRQPSTSATISVLVPVMDEERTVGELAARVAGVLDGLGRSFEIIFIDDGSSDATCARVREAHQLDARVKLIRLRRNFGKAAALCAGFDGSSGEIVITMDGDLQDDPDEIPRFLDKLEGEGLDLVSGWKHQRQDPIGKRYPSLLFNWATRLAGAGRPARLQLRLQGLPPRRARADRGLRRAAPLHPGAGQPARVHHRRAAGEAPRSRSTGAASTASAGCTRGRWI